MPLAFLPASLLQNSTVLPFIPLRNTFQKKFRKPFSAYMALYGWPTKSLTVFIFPIRNICFGNLNPIIMMRSKTVSAWIPSFIRFKWLWVNMEFRMNMCNIFSQVWKPIWKKKNTKVKLNWILMCMGRQMLLD